MIFCDQTPVSICSWYIYNCQNRPMIYTLDMSLIQKAVLVLMTGKSRFSIITNLWVDTNPIASDTINSPFVLLRWHNLPCYPSDKNLWNGFYNIWIMEKSQVVEHRYNNIPRTVLTQNKSKYFICWFPREGNLNKNILWRTIPCFTQVRTPFPSQSQPGNWRL